MTMMTDKNKKEGAPTKDAKDAKAPEAEGSKKKDLLKGADTLAEQDKKLAPDADAKKGAKTPQ